MLTAFFLEATFLGVMLFGMNRVPAWVHIATAMVALGTTLSAFWILALNSWMQTPAGHVWADGQWIAGDWFAVIFNPSFPYRLVHMMLASGLTASFVMAGLSAWRLLWAPFDTSAAKTLRTGLVIAAALVPMQIFVGDQHGLNTLKHQPAKIAAMEALWHTERGAPLVLFAIPDEEKRRNDYAIELPYGASLILKHEAKAELKGIDAFEPDRPPVAPLFFAFRVMVGIGVLMLLVSWFGVWKTRGGRAAPPWLLWVFAMFTFSGWVATLAGLDRDGGRAPAVARDRDPAHQGRGRRHLRRAARREPHRLHPHVCDPLHRVHGRAHAPRGPGREPGRHHARLRPGGDPARESRGVTPWICRSSSCSSWVSRCWRTSFSTATTWASAC